MAKRSTLHARVPATAGRAGTRSVEKLAFERVVRERSAREKLLELIVRTALIGNRRLVLFWRRNPKEVFGPRRCLRVPRLLHQTNGRNRGPGPGEA
jgi:hypothetical protein